MRRTRISTLLASLAKQPPPAATAPPPPPRAVVSGWVRSVRAQKARAFVHVDDGSCAPGLQLLLDETNTEVRRGPPALSTLDPACARLRATKPVGRGRRL